MMKIYQKIFLSIACVAMYGNPVLANPVKYYQSQLVDVENNQFMAYVSEDESSQKYKLRFTLYESQGNIATGNIGMTFSSKDGRIFFGSEAAAKLIELKNQLTFFVDESKTMPHDVYVRTVKISDSFNIVININKQRNQGKAFIHAKMSPIDSPLAPENLAVIEISLNSLNKMLGAIEDVSKKLIS